ncbi:hypothetical protein XF36_18735 [Pseudonocardia sp. HH130629-09]|nr:hypothetical protein XF36_18735 [Pseudonocardia sp. HH130629-09]
MRPFAIAQTGIRRAPPSSGVDQRISAVGPGPNSTGALIDEWRGTGDAGRWAERDGEAGQAGGRR